MSKNQDNSKVYNKAKEKFNKVMQEHFEDADNYLYHEEKYINLKNKYLYEIEHNGLKIEIEKARIESLSNKKLEGYTFVTGIIPVIIAFFMGNLFDYLVANRILLSKNAAKFVYGILVCIIVMISILNPLSLNTQNERFYNLCLSVLDDIEKEKENELKNTMKQLEDELDECVVTLDNLNKRIENNKINSLNCINKK